MCSVSPSHINFFSCISFSMVCFKHAVPLGIDYTLHKVVKGYKGVLITL